MKATPNNLTHQLTNELGKSVVNGEYAVGQGLPSEAELCVQYDVSRTAMREAVKMLSAKGLISSRPKQGIRVMPKERWNLYDTDVLGWILNSKPSLQLLKQFTEVRYAIEPVAAILAARHATREELESIERALGRMEDADQGLDDPLDADIDFHTSILAASGNPFFIQMQDFISTALRVSIRYTNKIKGVKAADADLHRDIFEKIKNRDEQGVRQAVMTILEEAIQLIDSQL